MRVAEAILVYQDDADFYRVDNEGLNEGEEFSSTHLWTAPFKVLDWDMKAAERARIGFVCWCIERYLTPIF